LAGWIRIKVGKNDPQKKRSEMYFFELLDVLKFFT
jgi:hypothetical protein